MRRIYFMIKKEFRQIFRDPPMVAIIFLMPVVQMLVLSFAITTEIKHVKLAVADLDNSVATRAITRAFANTDRFDVNIVTDDPAAVKEGMRSWDAQVGLVILPGFGRDLARGLVPQINIVMDGVDGNAASVAMGYAAGILQDYAEKSASEAPRGAGPGPGAGAAPETGTAVQAAGPRAFPARMQERMWYNPDLDSKNYMVPGIVVVLLTILPMMLSAMSLVKEKEIGTLEQLQVTPLGKRELLAGKLTPFLLLSFIELGIVTAVAVLAFGITMNGSYADLALAALVYLATTIGLGIFISTITGTQQQAMFVAWFFMMFMILMSGFFIPIENMPPFLRKLTLLNPMRYFLAVVRDLFQKGTPLSMLWKDLLAMTIYGVAIFSFGVMKFRKRLG